MLQCYLILVITGGEFFQLGSLPPGQRFGCLLANMTREDVIAHRASAELFVQKVPQDLRDWHYQLRKVRSFVWWKRAMGTEQRPVVYRSGFSKRVEPKITSAIELFAMVLSFGS